MPEKSSVRSTKKQSKKSRLIWALVGLSLLIIPLVASIPQGKMDTRNFAAETYNADIIPSPSGGDYTPNVPFNVSLVIVKRTDSQVKVSSAQATVSFSSRFSLDATKSHCNAPFDGALTSKKISNNTFTIMCTTPLSTNGNPDANLVDLPAAGIPFATINLTISSSNPSISPVISFDNKKVIEGGVTNSARNLSSSTSQAFGFGIQQVGATPTPSSAPSPVPTFIGAVCDLCGWCPPDNTNPNGKPSTWVQCNACLYNTDGSEKKGSYYTVLGCFQTDQSGAPFMQSVLQIVFGIAGGIAFVAVLLGIVIVITSSGIPSRIQLGKDMIISSIVGLLLILFSVFILRAIGLEILKIPGVG